MSIGWMTAFKAIPWRDVIAAAPAVALGAKKLWTSVKSARTDTAPEAGPETIEDQVRALQMQVSELTRESTASTELISSLAEQNARLVEAVEVLHGRVRILLAAGLVAAVLLLGLGIRYQFLP